MEVYVSRRLVRNAVHTTIALAIIALGLGLGAPVARAQGSSHREITYHRSSSMDYLFVTQAIEGEYGKYSFDRGGDEPISSEFWQGYGFRNAIGLELLKFIQLSASHTFVNNASKDEGSKRMTGSRVSGGLKLVFNAPVANLEIGGGMLASRLDYQHLLEHSTMYGSGLFYDVGLNYFVSGRVSFFGSVKQNRENLLRGSGNTPVKRIQTDSMSVGAGFRVWL